MKKELDAKLVKDFPLLYADRHKSAQETCMFWGLAVGDGWEPLIRELSEKLEPLIGKWILENLDRKEFPPRAAQVKEKFGTLRFYMNGYCGEEIRKAIREAEEKSCVTCEDCGDPGTSRSGGWYRTLCDECEVVRQERMK